VAHRRNECVDARPWRRLDVAGRDDAGRAATDHSRYRGRALHLDRVPTRAREPFPRAPEGCYDAAEWLIDNAEKRFDGAALSFFGCESAGAHLLVLTALHLSRHRQKRLRDLRLRSLLLHYGCYDLSLMSPQVSNFKKRSPLVVELDIIREFLKAFLPGKSTEEMKHPAILPLYADLTKITNLPAAFFTCGTEDSLLGDTLFMSTKWMASGGQALVKILPGAPYGHIEFPLDRFAVVKEGVAIAVKLK
jgi:acetyl esterase/lipase